jgi:hypothetical protein
MMLRLFVHIAKPQRVDLLDAALPPVKGAPDYRQLETDELWTPAGLPLRLYVRVGPQGDMLHVESAGALLAGVSAKFPGSVELLLPTEELLRMTITEVWAQDYAVT